MRRVLRYIIRNARFILPIMAIIGIFVYGGLTTPEAATDRPGAGMSRPAPPDTTGGSLYVKNYHACIERIMFNEDFQPRVYDCPAGYATIGFGHKLRPGEKFDEPMNWRVAYNLMKADFDESIWYAKRAGFVRKNGRQLAVAHCIYCLGVGTTKKILARGFVCTILKYHSFRANGKLIHSGGALRNRQFELNLFLYEKATDLD